MPVYKNPAIKKILAGELVITWKDLRSYLKLAQNNEHRNVLTFVFLSGLRPIELQTLMRKDFEIERDYLLVRIMTAKRGTTRRVMLPIVNKPTRDLVEFIKSKPFPKEYIFSHFSRVKNPRESFISLNKKSGIGSYIDNIFYPHSFYVFRHNIATLLVEEGVDPIEIRLFRGERLNPRLYGSMSYYVHFSRKMGLKIAKALKNIMNS